MEIIQSEISGIACAAFNGRMDADMTPDTQNAIDEILSDSNRVLFNLEGLESLSSYGLRIILKAVKKMRLKGGKIILCSLIENVREIFDVCGFGADIPITDNIEAGLKALT